MSVAVLTNMSVATFRQEKSIAQIREQVRQAALFVHAQGFYPSHYRLRSLLPGALMRDSEAREAWHAALQELGYEL